MDMDIVLNERTGPALLADTPPALPMKFQIPSTQWEIERSSLEGRLSMERSWRRSWISHWSLIARFVLPRRSLWLTQGGVDIPTPNSMTRGLPINQDIIDPTATLAMRVCAAGMMNGLMSASRPWFKLGPADRSIKLDGEAQDWFDECESRIYAVMAHSNFYESMATMFEDLVTYGTAPVIIYEDAQDTIRCFNPVMGEYYLANGGDFRVQMFGRIFTMTVTQIVERFGLKFCPEEIQSLWSQKGGSMAVERNIAHMIEPNYSLARPGDPITAKQAKVPGGYTWAERYWVWGTSAPYPLQVRGYRGNDAPFIAPRWATSLNDAYGRSPAMDALGDIMQLQVETRRKAELLEKHVRPPMNAPVELKNAPASILPGHLTFVSDTSKGMTPSVKVDPAAMQHITNDLKMIQDRIKVGFFNDLFMIISQMEGVQPRNELEIAERKGEKLQILGPVIEKHQNECASPAIKRIAAIMSRRKLLPQMPQSLMGMPIDIEYISMLALAQRAAATTSMERVVNMASQMNPLYQTADLVDGDEFMREYSERLASPHKILRDDRSVQQIRAQRQQQQAQQEQLEQAKQIAPMAADAAKTLSDTQLAPEGGGLNALQMMLGQGAGPPGAPM
jgi:Bacteriophage head to tail connecting protein